MSSSLSKSIWKLLGERTYIIHKESVSVIPHEIFNKNLHLPQMYKWICDVFSCKCLSPHRTPLLSDPLNFDLMAVRTICSLLWACFRSNQPTRNDGCFLSTCLVVFIAYSVSLSLFMSTNSLFRGMSLLINSISSVGIPLLLDRKYSTFGVHPAGSFYRFWRREPLC